MMRMTIWVIILVCLLKMLSLVLTL